MTRIVALDPGRNKCGLLLADTATDTVLQGRVLPNPAVLNQLRQWTVQAQLDQARLDELIIGNGTSSTNWLQKLPRDLTIHIVDETGTTLRARDRYWQLWPARGWKRLLPAGLRMPSSELDAIAALLILEDYLGRSLQWPGSDPFKNEPSQ